MFLFTGLIPSFSLLGNFLLGQNFTLSEGSRVHLGVIYFPFRGVLFGILVSLMLLALARGLLLSFCSTIELFLSLFQNFRTFVTWLIHPETPATSPEVYPAPPLPLPGAQRRSRTRPSVPEPTRTPEPISTNAQSEEQDFYPEPISTNAQSEEQDFYWARHGS